MTKEELLRSKMKILSVTQKSLASVMGVSTKTLQKWLANIDDVAPVKVSRLCTLLHLEKDERKFIQTNEGSKKK